MQRKYGIRKQPLGAILRMLTVFLKLAPLSISQLLLAAGIACVAVLWYEIVKFVKVSIG
ncbi:hypothetical protein SPSIL_037960 [Sporomusa silvacetica DSM 10669]|uniref:Uncharacterized protein n=1 Tax=Sporomusa silvacetica DSM 10669 TaxID=1123289 RepID=A0ABZ3IPC9_9FIRM|nr:hypothetical protein SPSIL_12290 [Sporomusa silvacetica DSM 10669]